MTSVQLVLVCYLAFPTHVIAVHVTSCVVLVHTTLVCCFVNRVHFTQIVMKVQILWTIRYITICTTVVKLDCANVNFFSLTLDLIHFILTFTG